MYLHTSEALFMGEYLELIVYLHENTCCGYTFDLPNNRICHDIVCAPKCQVGGYPFDLPNRICCDFVCTPKCQDATKNLQHTTFTDFTATLRNQGRFDIHVNHQNFKPYFPQR